MLVQQRACSGGSGGRIIICLRGDRRTSNLIAIRWISENSCRRMGVLFVCACLLAIQQQDDKKAHFSESHLILQVVPGKSPMMPVGNKCM